MTVHCNSAAELQTLQKLAGFDVAHVGQHIVTPPFHALYSKQ